ncbi:MAG: sulfatase [Flavobacterium sp.]|nr:sulfatase [Flavobacterium sp.]
MKKILCLFVTSLALMPFASQAQQNVDKNAASKPNVLFIAIDDLKPILGCYGNTLVKTPNIDRLAKMGTVFLSNYCQQAVCGPTRASVMTGMRPDHTKVWDLKTKMRDVNPDIISLPQYLISQGYTTAGVGKIYHPSCVDKKSDAPSWSIPFFKATAADYANDLGLPALKHYQSIDIKNALTSNGKGIKDNPKSENVSDDAESLGSGKRGPATECLNLPDNAYEDGTSANIGKAQLIALTKAEKPFFLAVGFHKPHLPFVAPKKYWDLYKRENMPMAQFQQHAENEVFVAYETSGELRNYSDIQAFTTFTKDDLRAGLKPEKQEELLHGYYAAVSYVDAQVGVLLNTLDSLGTLKNTIIVLWGDHGWHLGDHDIWGKHTNFEQATRSPLIVAAPGYKAGKTTSLTEHVDIFPTIVNLAGLEIPKTLQGQSLKPIMQNNKAVIKEFAVSQYPRNIKPGEVKKLGYANGKLMGYSIRTDKYRYTLWLNNKYTSEEPFTEARVYAAEMYDYVKDPLEKINVANVKAYASISKALKDKVIAYLSTQPKNFVAAAK